MIEAFISANVSKCSVIHQININVGFHVGGEDGGVGETCFCSN